MPRTPRPLVTPGQVVHLFSAAEARQWAADWLAIFGKNRRGIDTSAYLWHVFSYARYPSVHGAVSHAQYRQQTKAPFVVLANDRQLAFLTDLLPEASSLTDYYVFPPNFSWTIAFTHEDGWCGPYFARHPRFTPSCPANRAQRAGARSPATLMF